MDLRKTTDHFKILRTSFLLDLFGFEVSRNLMIFMNRISYEFETFRFLFDYEGVRLLLDLVKFFKMITVILFDGFRL